MWIITLSPKDKNKLEELQQNLSKYNQNYKFEGNKIKSPFQFQFRDKIDKDYFICFKEYGIFSLYSEKENIKK